MQSSALLLLLLLAWRRVGAYFLPCNGSSPLGGSCDIDADCTGTGVVCTLGKCQCDSSYALLADQQQQLCVKVPDTIGASCTTSCRFPLFCDNRQCQCIRSRREGNQCFVDSYLGQSCKRHIECTIPFSACVNKQCDCVKGTTRRGNSCHAAAHCPMGGPVGRACTIRTVDTSVVHNVINSGGVLDTCQSGQFCFAPTASLTGNCCPVTCPLSSKPALEYGCDGRSMPGRTCPYDTHFCHRVGGASFSYSVCCRSPCREPKPVYINGQCYGRGYLGSTCELDAQCDGGASMRCHNGVCSCKTDYRPESTEHPSAAPLKCVRSQCSKSNALAEHDCLERSNLGEQCISTLQCPPGSQCFRGLCFCECNMVRHGNTCTAEVPRQPTKPLIGGPLTGGLFGGGQGLSIANRAGGGGGGLFNVVQNILKGVRTSG